MGLGLAMVKRLMVQFGGVLRLSNRQEGGALVELSFKTNRSAPDLSSVPERLPPPPEQPRNYLSLPPTASATSATASDPASKSTSLTRKGSDNRSPPSSEVGAPAPVIQKAYDSSGGRSAHLGGLDEPVRRWSIGGETFLTCNHTSAVPDSQMTAKVLIVDDDPVNLTILEDLLR